MYLLHRMYAYICECVQVYIYVCAYVYVYVHADSDVFVVASACEECCVFVECYCGDPVLVPLECVLGFSCLCIYCIVCMYIYVDVFRYVSVCVCVCVCMCQTHLSTEPRGRNSISGLTHIHVHTYMHILEPVWASQRITVSSQLPLARHLQSLERSMDVTASVCPWSLYTNMMLGGEMISVLYICIYACVCACMCVCVCMYVCVHEVCMLTWGLVEE